MRKKILIIVLVVIFGTICVSYINKKYTSGLKLEILKLKQEQQDLVEKLKKYETAEPFNKTNEQRKVERIKVLKNKNQEHNKSLEIYNKKSNILFFGDSLTSEANWNDFFLDYNYISNKGQEGNNTADALKRIETVLKNNPSKVFIMLGINDIFQSIPTNDIISNYELIIDILLKDKINVFVQSTISCYIPYCGAETSNQVNELNKALIVLTSKKNVQFINLSELSSVYGLQEKYTRDGIHLSFIGYEYWIHQLKPFL